MGASESAACKGANVNVAIERNRYSSGDVVNGYVQVSDLLEARARR